MTCIIEEILKCVTVIKVRFVKTADILYLCVDLMTIDNFVLRHRESQGGRCYRVAYFLPL